MVHHADCWAENRGCATYACGRGPQAATSRATARASAHPSPPGPQVPGAYYPPGVPPSPGWAQRYAPQSTMGALAAILEQKATTALIYSLAGLFCCPVMSLVGLLLGVMVFSSPAPQRVLTASARSKAVGAIVAGIITFLFWTAFMFWALAEGFEAP